MTQKKETPQEYTDRQIRTLKNEITTLHAEKEGLNIFINKKTKEYYTEIITLKSKIKNSKAIFMVLVGTLFMTMAIGAFISNVLIYENNSLQQHIKDKTWEYHPQNFQLKLADEYLQGKKFMSPSDTAVFIAPQSQYKLLIIKKPPTHF